VVSTENRTTKSIIWIIRQCIFYVPLLFLLYNNLNVLISMSANPWGCTEIHFIIWKYEIHSLTMTYITVFYLLLFFDYYSELDPIMRVGCSTVIPLFGLFFYEFWWHLGCWIVWKWCAPFFWGVFVVTLAICINYINQRYNILNLTMNRFLIWVVMFLLFLAGWWELLDRGFYQSLLLYEQGFGPDPHGLFTSLIKGVSIFIWLCFVRRIDK